MYKCACPQTHAGVYRLTGKMIHESKNLSFCVLTFGGSRKCCKYKPRLERGGGGGGGGGLQSDWLVNSCSKLAILYLLLSQTDMTKIRKQQRNRTCE